MKVSKNILALALGSLLLASCTEYRSKAEELTVPLIQALQDNDAKDAACLLPPKDEMANVFEANKGQVGYVYYNKYRRSYSREVLSSKMTTDFDIIDKISKEQKLDWSTVRYGTPKAEAVTADDATFTKVTCNLQFDGSKVYTLTYNAVRAANNWYLFNDVYFVPAAQ